MTQRPNPERLRCHLVAAVAALGCVVTAAVAEPLPCGTTLERRIEFNSDQGSYTFDARAGERVVASVGRASGGSLFNPYWELFGPPPDRQRVKVDGITACPFTHPCTSEPLPADGGYTILVYDSANDATGSYSVTMEAVAQNADGMSNHPPQQPTCERVRDGHPDGTRALPCGETAQGGIEVEGETDSYTFAARAGERVVASVGRASGGSFNPYWELFGPDGQQVKVDGITACPFTHPCTSEPLPADGGYTILVYDSANDATGSYSVTMEAVAQNADGMSNHPPQQPTCERVRDGHPDGTRALPCGETAQGGIEVEGETDSYTFAARAGGRVVASVGRASGGSFNPYWELFGPDGQQVKVDGITACPFTHPCTSEPLPADGGYTILVYNSQNDATGSYNLTRTLLGEECPCGNSVVEASEGEQCDQGGANGPTSCCDANCTFRVAGSVCRAVAGACDVQETCPGNNGACPTDGFLSSATVCRAAAGECDLAENCPGNNANCPADTKKANATPCAPDDSLCSLDQCDGSTVTCQHPAGNAGVTCRAATGVCDVAETCTGSSATCPADAFVSSSTVCRAAGGECDLAENCPGNGPNCPADAKRGNGTPCTDDGNPCTLDQCDLTGTCQHPAGNPGAVCRASAGVCDVVETCPGASTTCPADGFAPSSAVCRAAAGECDLAENCPGNGANCPADAKRVNGTPCTDDGNPCSLDQCDGTSVTCQHPAGNAGVTCRAATGVCDVAETCTGSSTTCPADAFQADGTSCDDGRFCTDPDHCQGGACIGPARGCSDNKTCTVDTCDEVHHCVSTPTPGACDDGNSCTDDQCGSGPAPSGCEHTVAADGTPCDNGQGSAGGTCQGGKCRDPMCVSRSDGATCNDDDDCTDDDACEGGVCAGHKECGVLLSSCDVTTSGAVCSVSCTGECQILIKVTIQGRPRSRCSAVLFEASASSRQPMIAAERRQPKKKEPCQPKKKARRLSRKATGTIDASGHLELNLPLNPLARWLLKNCGGGQLPADARVHINERPKHINERPKHGGARRLLDRLINIVRG